MNGGAEHTLVFLLDAKRIDTHMLDADVLAPLYAPKGLPPTVQPTADLFMAEEHVNRRLAAILAADVVGYSRLMGVDEAGTLAALKRHRETVFSPAVTAHNGRIVKLIGDGVIAELRRLHWDRLNDLLTRHPLPAARIVHRYTAASEALP